MKLALVGDAHLIDPNDPHDGRRTARMRFVEAWPSFEALLARINSEAVDHVCFTGDLVDYYSRENREFALDLVSQLNMPWTMVPGNHDYQLVDERDDEVRLYTDRSACREEWEAAGVGLHNRSESFGDVQLLLLDSALSDIPAGTESWFESIVQSDQFTILCTHVPVNQPAVVEAITDREPDRNLTKYVQSGVPDRVSREMVSQVDAIVSGHLHFQATAKVGNATQYILPLSIRRSDPRYRKEGSFVIVDTNSPDSFQWITV